MVPSKDGEGEAKRDFSEKPLEGIKLRRRFKQYKVRNETDPSYRVGKGEGRRAFITVFKKRSKQKYYKRCASTKIWDILIIRIFLPYAEPQQKCFCQKSALPCVNRNLKPLRFVVPKAGGILSFFF